MVGLGNYDGDIDVQAVLDRARNPIWFKQFLSMVRPCNYRRVSYPLMTLSTASC